eukprot:gene9177-11250_t
MSNDKVEQNQPTVEEIQEDESTLPTDTTEEEQNQGELNSISLSIKTPVESVGTIQIQVTPNDTVFDLQNFLFETTETCLFSNYALHLNGERLNEYHELSQVPGLESGTTLEMLPVEYNERTAKLHVKRLRDVLSTGINEFSNSNNPTLFTSFSFPEKSLIKQEDQQEQPTTEGEKSEASTPSTDAETTTTTPSPSTSSPEPSSPAVETTTTTKKPNPKKKNSKKSKQQQQQQSGDEPKLSAQQKLRKEKLTTINQFEKPILSEYFPSNAISSIQCVKQLNYSGWSPVPGYRKLCGDLFYLDITLLEGTQICVTASIDGFFVNQSTTTTFNPLPSSRSLHSHCLHQVLNQISRKFRSGLNGILSNISTLHPFEMIPGPIPTNSWLSRPRVNRFDINKSSDSNLTIQDNEMRGQPRDWNEELQNIKELPKTTVQERLVRDRAFAKVNSEFVEAAIRGAQVVVNKSIPPINPLDPERAQMFLYHNIFFSYPLDTRDIYKDCGGDKAARASANNDLRGIRLYNLADIDGLHTLATAIIDFRGQRVVAQSLVPGILTNEKTSTVLYGSMDSGKTAKADPEFQELLNKAGQMLHIAEREVVPEEGEAVKLVTSIETKGIVGTDGRKYVLDLLRATPRDPNFPEATHLMSVLRPELVVSFAEYVKDNWDKKKSEEQKDAPSTPTTEEEKPPQILFNPNLLSNIKLGGSEEEQKKDLETLKSIGVFLKNIVIPKLIEDFILFNSAPVDGQTLTTLMHTRGINIRYMGQIANNPNAKIPFIQDLFFNEMVSRATKHLFNDMLRETSTTDLSVTIAHFLNCFLGTETGTVSAEEKTKKFKNVKSRSVHDITHSSLWESIAASIKEKYDFEITTHSIPMESRLTVLRSLCLKTGLQILAKDYSFTTDYPFASEDIVDLQCVVKHLNPRSTDGLDLLESGRGFFAQRRFEIAGEILNESLAIYHQVHGPIHADTAHCYSTLALLAYYHLDNIDLAIEHQKNAVVITEKVFGFDHQDTIHSYTTLSAFCQRAGRFNEAMGYLKRALYLTDMLGGEYNPERSAIYSSIANLLQETEKLELSIEFFLQALKHQEFLFGADHIILASTYHSISFAHANLGDFKEAISYEKRAYHILEKEYGVEHARTKDSSNYLTSLTQAAVKVQKDIKMAQLQQQQILQVKRVLAQNPQFQQAFAQSRIPKPPSNLNTNGSVNELLNYINGKPKKVVKVISKSKQQPTTQQQSQQQQPPKNNLNNNNNNKPNKQPNKSTPTATTTTTTTTTTTKAKPTTTATNNTNNNTNNNKPKNKNTSQKIRS